MVTGDLENELAKLVEQLRPGGTQQQCTELRARITAIREAIAHREKNIAFVRDDFIDGE
jgi:hypothetical protein